MVPTATDAQPSAHSWPPPPIAVAPSGHPSWPPAPAFASSSTPPPTGLAALATTRAQRIYVAVTTTIMALMAVALFVMGCDRHRLATAQAAAPPPVAPSQLSFPLAAEPPPVAPPPVEAAVAAAPPVAASTTTVAPPTSAAPSPPPVHITPTPLARPSAKQKGTAQTRL